MRMGFVNRRSLIALIGATVLLGACGSLATAPGSSEGDVVLERARAYWGVMQKNDPVSAWKFEAASQDQSLTMDAYFKRGGIVYDAVEVRSVRMVSEDAAEVEVSMRYTLPLVRVKNQEATVQDHWRRIDGVWYHEIRRGVLFGDKK